MYVPSHNSRLSTVSGSHKAAARAPRRLNDNLAQTTASACRLWVELSSRIHTHYTMHCSSSLWRANASQSQIEGRKRSPCQPLRVSLLLSTNKTNVPFILCSLYATDAHDIAVSASELESWVLLVRSSSMTLLAISKRASVRQRVRERKRREIEPVCVPLFSWYILITHKIPRLRVYTYKSRNMQLEKYNIHLSLYFLFVWFLPHTLSVNGYGNNKKLNIKVSVSKWFWWLVGGRKRTRERERENLKD